MPDGAAHAKVALHDVETVCFLDGHPEYHDWTATVTFYAALHVVEALFANKRPPEHGKSHERREALLKKERQYDSIYRHYRALWAAAQVARYLEELGSGRTHSVFADYMSPEDVRRTLVKHHLVSVVHSAVGIGRWSSEQRGFLDAAVETIKSLP
jgi:hypothetical protein